MARRTGSSVSILQLDPGSHGLGGGLGAVGVHPVGRDHVALGWDARLEFLELWRRADYGAPGRGEQAIPDTDLYEAVRDHVDLYARTDVRLRPAGGPTTVTFGVEAAIQTALAAGERDTDTTVRFGPYAGLGWTF